MVQTLRRWESLLFGGVAGPPTAAPSGGLGCHPGVMSSDRPASSLGTELGQFLRARRAQITPADVGLPSHHGPRRTPGLRREELATLAGISSDYYVRLERGKETRPSDQVIARSPAHCGWTATSSIICVRLRHSPPGNPPTRHRCRPGRSHRAWRCCWRACAPTPPTWSDATVICSPGTQVASASCPASRTGPSGSATYGGTHSSIPPLGYCSTTGTTNFALASRICGHCPDWNPTPQT